MPGVDIRKDDIVRVIAGKDRGKDGRVVRVLPREGRVMVDGVAMAKKHQRTGAARLAMACYMLVLGTALVAGVVVQAGTGVQIAAAATVLAITAEVSLLAWQALPVLHAMRQSPAAV